MLLNSYLYAFTSKNFVNNQFIKLMEVILKIVLLEAK